MVEWLTDVIGDIVNNEYELMIHSTYLSNEILQQARNNNIDLFCMTLNNIIYTDCDSLPDDRTENTLKFVSNIKNEFQKPIIAMAGWPNDPEYAKRVISAGADCFFKIPVKISDYQDAVRTVLANRPLEIHK